MTERNLVIAVCVGMASAAVLGILLADEIAEKTLPLEMNVSAMQRMPGDPVVISLTNTGSYTLLFPDSMFGISVEDSDGLVVWAPAPAYNLKILKAKQTQNITWDTAGMKSGEYTVYSRVSSIEVSHMIEIV